MKTTTETIYTITNDRYSNNADRVTFAQLVEMCNDMGWNCELRIVGDRIVDERNETVAVAE